MRGHPVIRTLAVAGVLAACAGAPAQAQSGGPAQVYEDYAPDGTIDPCEHTTEDLQAALDGVPPDVEQYAADYPAAIDAAIEARARGECDDAPPPAGDGSPGGAGPGTAEDPAAATGTPAPAGTAAPGGAGAAGEVVPAPPAPPAASAQEDRDVALERAASTDAGPPLVVVLLGALLAVMALAALAAFAARRLGLAEERLAPAAHAWREAAWRAGGTWADFRDWVRLGR